MHNKQFVHKRDIIDLYGRRTKEERPATGPRAPRAADKAHALALYVCNLDQKRALFCIWPFYRWQGRPAASGPTRDALCLDEHHFLALPFRGF